MRNAVVLAGLVLILAVLNVNTYRYESLLRDGQLLLMELAPVDPRSLMQGDYMALRFAAADEARKALGKQRLASGTLILRRNELGVGEFARIDTGETLAADELRMQYRVRNGRLRFTTDAYFFQEGNASVFEAARYGGFRVEPSGKALLSAMYDENRVLIEAPASSVAPQ